MQEQNIGFLRYDQKKMPMQKTATILIIGDEVLSGRTQDANTSFLASRLGELGIEVVETRTVRDVSEEIIRAVNELRARSDYLFTTGGIGPTHDDITSECIAKAFGVGFGVNAEARKRLEAYYAARGTEVNEARLRMAMIPEGAKLIDNPVSTAPGFNVGNVYVMAGVPKIMQAMFEGIALTLEGGAPMTSVTITCDKREGDIAAELTDIQNKYPEVKIGSYPSIGGPAPSLSLVLRGTDGVMVEKAARDVEKLVGR